MNKYIGVLSEDENGAKGTHNNLVESTQQFPSHIKEKGGKWVAVLKSLHTWINRCVNHSLPDMRSFPKNL